MARFFSFLCLAAAALLLLSPPVQARLGIGLGGGSGVGRVVHPPVSAGQHVDVVGAARFSFSPGGVHSTAKAAKPAAWSSSSWTTAAATGRVRPELRAVPGGPDPLHHHGSPWRPELELEPTTP